MHNPNAEAGRSPRRRLHGMTVLITLIALLVITGPPPAIATGDQPLPEHAASIAGGTQEVVNGNPDSLVTSVSGSLKRFRFKGADDEVTTTSLAFATIPNMKTDVNLKEAGSMLITFCGECTSSGSYNNFPIRISVGDEEALPAGSALRYGYPRPYGDDYYQMGCTQYFVPDVAAGEHSVKAEWCVTSFYQTAACRDRSLLVQYFK